ncbi:MAG: DbpA RNA binding domain-containing protein [Lachnospiraceae bacterium]|nr:DbpA RNA binding domain-containing protein [Lachnospiraceae bacterium]
MLSEKRLYELRDNSRKNGTFYFTDFLSQAEVSDVLQRFTPHEVTLSGGCEGTERMMARFGDPEDLGYEIPFPIALLKITPLHPKFADDLNHRDFLGSLMNLGIERDIIGDIIVRDKAAYIFVAERMADHIEKELSRVKHTPVMVEKVDDPPEDINPRFEGMNLILSSLRLDLIISKVYHISRQAAKECFSDGRAFLNGKLCTNPAASVKEDDVLSVRGFGKFAFRQVDHETKKGNLAVRIDKYV